MGLRGMNRDGLRDAIVARREQAGKSFLDNLEKKYSEQASQPRNKRSRRGN